MSEQALVAVRRVTLLVPRLRACHAHTRHCYVLLLQVRGLELIASENFTSKAVSSPSRAAAPVKHSLR